MVAFSHPLFPSDTLNPTRSHTGHRESIYTTKMGKCCKPGFLGLPKEPASLPLPVTLLIFLGSTLKVRKQGTDRPCAAREAETGEWWAGTLTGLTSLKAHLMVTHLLLTVPRGFSVWRDTGAEKSWLKMSEHTSEETMSSLEMRSGPPHCHMASTCALCMTRHCAEWFS